ncbi:protein transparent testa 9 isoform X1 [Tanacetum coccineum]
MAKELIQVETVPISNRKSLVPKITIVSRKFCCFLKPIKVLRGLFIRWALRVYVNNDEACSLKVRLCRDALISYITSGDDTQVVGSLSVLATFLQTKELDESMLDALGILPQCKQHKKLLLKAMVGEDSGEEQRFTSKNCTSKDGSDGELNVYLQRLKIIKRVDERECDPLELSVEFCREFLTDMANLQCLPPTVQPRVSDHMLRKKPWKNSEGMVMVIVDSGVG